MSVKTGRLGWVGVALEATPGVPVNPTDYFPFLEASLMDKQSVLADVGARGIRDEQGENSQLGKRWGEGALKINLDPTLSPYLLGMALGTFGSPVSEGSGVYTHTFTRLNSNQPKSGSIIFNRVTDQELYPYSVINSLDVNYSDGLAELSANILSSFPQTSVSGTLTTASGTLFSFRQAQVQFGSNMVNAQASATFQKLRSFSLTINDNAEAQFVSGNRDVDSIIQKNFNASGSMRLAFESTTEKDNFNALVKQAMIVTFTGNGIGGGMSEYLKFRFFKLRWDDFKVEVPPNDFISQEITFVAEYDSSNSSTMDIIARNRKASY